MGIIVTGSRHSIRPSLNLDFANSKVLDPRITFTRASNATYYDGYTSVKAEENLIPYSQDISQWNIQYNQGIVLTTNQTTAPDGTSTADKVTTNTDANAMHAWKPDNINLTSGDTYTVSAFLKQASGTPRFGFRCSNQSSIHCAFDLDATSVVNTSNCTASITDVGNDWKRCVMTWTTTQTVESIQFHLMESTSTVPWSYYTANGTDALFVWGAQLEQRDTVTSYTPTTSSPITKYQPALQTAGNNVARFDHNPTTGESLGLLIEEQRTNSQSNSEDISGYTKSGTTVTSNDIIAPDGTLTADKLVEDTSTGSHKIRLTGLNAYGTVSVYLKAKEKSQVVLRWRNSPNNHVNGANIDLANGTFTAFSVNEPNRQPFFEDVGNGWYRVGMYYDYTTTDFAKICELFLTEDDDTYNISSHTGDGYSGIHVWGVQWESTKSFPTSYIKTTGSQVTRSADDAKMENINQDDWFKQSKGTWFVNAKTFEPVSNDDKRIIQVDTEGQSNRFPDIYIESDDVKALFIRQGLTLTATDFVSSDTYFKYSLAYEYQNANVAGDGTAQTANTTLTGTTSDLTTIYIGRYSGNDYFLNGYIKKLTYYPTRLTDNEIIDLTEE